MTKEEKSMLAMLQIKVDNGQELSGMEQSQYDYLIKLEKPIENVGVQVETVEDLDNLFIPVVQSYTDFKSSFMIVVDSAIIVNVPTDSIRKLILGSKPHLEENMSDWMPSEAELLAAGKIMCDLKVEGVEDNQTVTKSLSLNRMISMDKSNSWAKVYKVIGDKKVLIISKIIYDAEKREVIFS